MTILTVIIPGRPIPAVRTTQHQKHIDPRYKKYAIYKQYAGYIAKQAMREQKVSYIPEKVPIDFKAVVSLATRHKIDVDNILKSLMDSFNKIVWYDDCQVMSAYIAKEWVTDKADEKAVIYVSTLE